MTHDVQTPAVKTPSGKAPSVKAPAVTSAGDVPAADRSVSQLVGDLSEQMSRLVRDEMRLATTELQQKGKRLGAGAGLAGAAGMVALIAVLVLVAAAVLGLATVLPGWAAALIVGGALLIVAAIAALAGKSQLKRATPPVPQEAAASVQKDVEVLKESVHS